MSVLTFLFTDIEGSTRRWEADANAMRAALETHNQTLRDAVKAHGGQVFNYTGDGMCAVFTSPRPAVEAVAWGKHNFKLCFQQCGAGSFQHRRPRSFQQRGPYCGEQW